MQSVSLAKRTTRLLHRFSPRAVRERMAASPPQVVPYPADHSIARVGQPLVIVAHDTEGVDSRSTLKTGDARGVSIHALIQKFPRANGSTDVLPGWPPRSSGVVIYRMVPDERGANHAGFSTWTHAGKTYTPSGVNVNAVSLGFELECKGSTDPRDRYSDDQLLAAGWLINGWRAKYGHLPIVRHAEIDPKRRSDTYHLTVAELEKWANAAAVVYDAPPLTKRYRVKPRYVTQRQEGGPPYVRPLVDGEVVTVDRWYTNGRVHFATGEGFADLSDLEAT